MPVLKLFEQCEARPPVNGNPFLLPNHLLAVACRWGNINGNPESKIYFLAGLCHDMAKARMKWQDNLNGPRGSRPPHAAPSALVFSDGSQVMLLNLLLTLTLNCCTKAIYCLASEKLRFSRNPRST